MPTPTGQKDCYTIQSQVADGELCNLVSQQDIMINPDRNIALFYSGTTQIVIPITQHSHHITAALGLKSDKPPRTTYSLRRGQDQDPLWSLTKNHLLELHLGLPLFK